MKEKGFTLIELLAVIVILAIIALIAVPIILNIIDEAKEESNKKSIELYASAIENAAASYLLNNPNDDDMTFDKIKDYIAYGGNNVECDITKIRDDGSIFLDKCKINGKYVKYIYGYGYTELEYIETTGTQWFDLKQDSFNKTTVVTYSADDQYLGLGNVIIGSSYNGPSNRYHCTLYSNAYYYGNNTSERRSGSAEYGKIHTIEYNSNKGQLVVDGKVTDSNSFTPTEGDIIYIGRRVSSNLYSKMKYYSIKLYDKDTEKLILDLIPVLDDNNVPCLFDKVQKEFYYNAGTGDFNYKQFNE